MAVFGLALAIVATSDVRLTGEGGDWRAASEGLHRSGQPGVLAAGRRVIVHFHGLDGRPGILVLAASSRRADGPVHLVGGVDATTATSPSVDVVLPVAPLPLTIPLPAGTRDVDLRLEASGLFRVSEIGLRRALDARSVLARVVPAALGLAVLAAAWGRGPAWAATAWGLLAAAGAACVWVFAFDPGSAVRFDPDVLDLVRVAALAALWVAALARADSRPACAAAIVGTVALLHLPTVRYGFYQDDFALARGWSWSELARTLHGEFDPSGMIPAYYRPLVRLSWAVDHALWGAQTAGYHVTNLCLHTAAGLLVWTLLRRAALGAAAALLGALAWVAHPLSASTATWVSARGDSLMAVFYLSALIALCAPRSGLRASLAAGGLALLALGTKEMAVSLPAVAFLLDRVLLPRDGRKARRGRLRLVAALTAAYLALYAAAFAGKVAARAAGGPRWAGFDPRAAGDWLGLLPALFTPLFLPGRYETWWLTPLRAWPMAYLAAGLGVAILAWWVASRGPEVGGRSATVGLIWPLATALPLLGLASTLDFYRLGYLVAVAVAFVVAGLAVRFEGRRPVVAVLAVGLAAALGPLSIDAARAWADDGFRGRASLRWKAAEPSWVAQLTPEMAGVFTETVARHCHALVWAYPDERCP